MDVDSEWVHLLAQLTHGSVEKDRTCRGDLQNHRAQDRGPLPRSQGSTAHAHKKGNSLCPVTQSILPEQAKPPAHIPPSSW